jgi:hypothetical protein
MDAALRRHDELLQTAVDESAGYVFKKVGDSFCVAFPTAESAIGAAASAQRALTAEPWPEKAILRVRMALHTGACVERDGDYFGPTVNHPKMKMTYRKQLAQKPWRCLSNAPPARVLVSPLPLRQRLLSPPSADVSMEYRSPSSWP